MFASLLKLKEEMEEGNREDVAVIEEVDESDNNDP